MKALYIYIINSLHLLLSAGSVQTTNLVETCSGNNKNNNKIRNSNANSNSQEW